MPYTTYQEFAAQFKNMPATQHYNLLKEYEANHQYMDYVPRALTEFGLKYTFCVKCGTWQPKKYFRTERIDTLAFTCAVCYEKKGDDHESNGDY